MSNSSSNDSVQANENLEVAGQSGEVTFGADQTQEPQSNAEKSAADPQTSNGKPWATDKDGNSLGYPIDTPIQEMSIEEQAAYWKRQSRKHENEVRELRKQKTPEEVEALEKELAELKSKVQTEDERRFEEAIARAREEGEQAARDFYLPRLHETQIRGYAHTFIKDEAALNEWISGIAIDKFVDPETQMIDGAKVKAHLEAIYGAQDNGGSTITPPQFSNVGQFQGRRKERIDYSKQGAEEAARRFGTTN